jgi:hypothetical protein
LDGVFSSRINQSSNQQNELLELNSWQLGFFIIQNFWIQKVGVQKMMTQIKSGSYQTQSSRLVEKLDRGLDHIMVLIVPPKQVFG